MTTTNTNSTTVNRTNKHGAGGSSNTTDAPSSRRRRKRQPQQQQQQLQLHHDSTRSSITSDRLFRRLLLITMILAIIDISYFIANPPSLQQLQLHTNNNNNNSGDNGKMLAGIDFMNKKRREWLQHLDTFIVSDPAAADGSSSERPPKSDDVIVPITMEQAQHQEDSSDENDNAHSEEHEQEGDEYEEQHPQKQQNSANDGETNSKSIDMEEIQPILDLLRAADITIDSTNTEMLSQLPHWSDIVNLYGSQPIIHGLETCSHFQSVVPPAERFIGAAGIFNTGTNLLAELLQANCQNPHRMAKYGSVSKGMRWQVPWGKHSPLLSYRGAHLTQTDRHVPYQNILPVAVIKDPYHWMVSMCKHKYAARFRKTKEHCPNLVLNDVDSRAGIRGVKDKQDADRWGSHVETQVKYPNGFTHHTTLAHLWNDWYMPYYNHTSVSTTTADTTLTEEDQKNTEKNVFPRLIVRFEDLLFHAEEVMGQICKCGGGELRYGPVITTDTKAAAVAKRGRHKKFRYITDTAKPADMGHKSSTGLLQAIIKYGNDLHRYDGYDVKDVQYAHHVLDRNLIEKFGYADPPHVEDGRKLQLQLDRIRKKQK